MAKNKKSPGIYISEEELDRHIKRTNRNLYIVLFALVVAVVTLVVVSVKIVYQ